MTTKKKTTKKATKKATNAERYVLVTTMQRGVFAGVLVGEATAEKVELRQARNCVYWDVGARGFVGLASEGPGSACKIGPPAPEMTLYGITSVVACTDAARAKWEAAPWSR